MGRGIFQAQLRRHPERSATKREDLLRVSTDVSQVRRLATGKDVVWETTPNWL